MHRGCFSVCSVAQQGKTHKHFSCPQSALIPPLFSYCITSDSHILQLFPAEKTSSCRGVQFLAISACALRARSAHANAVAHIATGSEFRGCGASSQGRRNSSVQAAHREQQQGPKAHANEEHASAGPSERGATLSSADHSRSTQDSARRAPARCGAGQQHAGQSNSSRAGVPAGECLSLGLSAAAPCCEPCLDHPVCIQHPRMHDWACKRRTHVIDAGAAGGTAALPKHICT